MPTIQLKNISKNYGRNAVLNDVNATIKSGECFAIIGSNGKGKSTLLKILAGIIPASKGQVIYDSLVLNKNRKKIAKEIGVDVKSVLTLFKKP